LSRAIRLKTATKHTAVDEIEGEVLAASPERVRSVERRRDVLGAELTRREAGDTRRDQEWTVGIDERVSDGLDCGPLGRVRGGHVGPVVLVGEVNGGLGVARADANGVEVVEVAAQHPYALGLEGFGGRVRSCQTGDVVTGGEEVVDDGGADPPGGPGDENVHVLRSQVS